jgi:hypothetical protein
MYYNFVRIHQTLKISPAMAAGVTDRLWEMSDVVDMLDAWEAKEKRDAASVRDFGVKDRRRFLCARHAPE